MTEDELKEYKEQDRKVRVLIKGLMDLTGNGRFFMDIEGCDVGIGNFEGEPEGEQRGRIDICLSFTAQSTGKRGEHRTREIARMLGDFAKLNGGYSIKRGEGEDDNE